MLANFYNYTDQQKLSILLDLVNNPIPNKETDQIEALAQVPFKLIIELEEDEFKNVLKLYCDLKYGSSSDIKFLQLQQAKGAFDKIKNVLIDQHETGSIAAESFRKALLYNLSKDHETHELPYPVGPGLSRAFEGNDGQEPLACVQQLVQKISSVGVEKRILEYSTEEEQIEELQKGIPILANEIFNLLFDDSGAFHPPIKKIVDAITEIDAINATTQVGWFNAMVLNIAGLFCVDRTITGMHYDYWFFCSSVLSTLCFDKRDKDELGLLAKFFSTSGSTLTVSKFKSFFENNPELQTFYNKTDNKELIQLQTEAEFFSLTSDYSDKEKLDKLKTRLSAVGRKEQNIADMLEQVQSNIKALQSRLDALQEMFKLIPNKDIDLVQAIQKIIIQTSQILNKTKRLKEKKKEDHKILLSFYTTLEMEIDKLEPQVNFEYTKESPEEKKDRRAREFLAYDAIQCAEKAKALNENILKRSREIADTYSLSSSIIKKHRVQEIYLDNLYGDSNELQSIKISLANLENQKKDWKEEIKKLNQKIEMLEAEITDDEKIILRVYTSFIIPPEDLEQKQIWEQKFKEIEKELRKAENIETIDKKIIPKLSKFLGISLEDLEKYYESTFKFRQQLVFKKEELKHNKYNLLEGIAGDEIKYLSDQISKLENKRDELELREHPEYAGEEKTQRVHRRRIEANVHNALAHLQQANKILDESKKQLKPIEEYARDRSNSQNQRLEKLASHNLSPLISESTSAIALTRSEENFFDGERKYFDKILDENRELSDNEIERLFFQDQDKNTLAHYIAKKGDLNFYEKIVSKLGGEQTGLFHTPNSKGETAFQLRPLVKCESNALKGAISALPVSAFLAGASLFLAAGFAGPIGVAVWALAWLGVSLIAGTAAACLYDKLLTPFRSNKSSNKDSTPSIILISE